MRVRLDVRRHVLLLLVGVLFCASSATAVLDANTTATNSNATNSESSEESMASQYPNARPTVAWRRDRIVKSGHPELDPENNPVHFNGRLSAKFLKATNVAVRAKGYNLVAMNLVVRDQLNATRVHARKYSSDFMSVRKIRNFPGERTVLSGSIQINGNIIWGGTSPSSMPAAPQTTAFLETHVSLLSHHEPHHPSSSSSSPRPRRQFMKQWKLVAHDDFDAAVTEAREQIAIDNAKGRPSVITVPHVRGWTWSDGTPATFNASHCGNFDHFLLHSSSLPTPSSSPSSSSSSSASASASSTNNDATDRVVSSAPYSISISKTFTNLPAHSKLSLTGRVHFLDGWRDGVVYAMVDGEYVWLESHDNSHEQPTLSGSGEQEEDAAGAPLVLSPSSCGMGRWSDRLSVPVGAMLPHTAATVNITFGCTSSSSATASFGIDDVSISVK